MRLTFILIALIYLAWALWHFRKPILIVGGFLVFAMLCFSLDAPRRHQALPLAALAQAAAPSEPVAPAAAPSGEQQQQAPHVLAGPRIDPYRLYRSKVCLYPLLCGGPPPQVTLNPQPSPTPPADPYAQALRALLSSGLTPLN
jgi:hypothetical protein